MPFPLVTSELLPREPWHSYYADDDLELCNGGHTRHCQSQGNLRTDRIENGFLIAAVLLPCTSISLWKTPREVPCRNTTFKIFKISNSHTSTLFSSYLVNHQFQEQVIFKHGGGKSNINTALSLTNTCLFLPHK